MNKRARVDFVIPAIDIIGGKAVRLTQGDYAKKTIYHEDPVELARSFEAAGLQRLHLVDLDGAKAGSIQNISVLQKIAVATSLKIDFGGGVKTRQDVENIISAGAEMVTVGSLAVMQPLLLQEWLEEWGADKFFIGADVYDEQIKTHGWLQDGGISIQHFLEHMQRVGVAHFFCTDIKMDGALQGTSIALYKKLVANFPGISLVASGGVASMDDVRSAQQAGCSGVIVGKAIYEGRISLDELQQFNHSLINDNHAL